MAKFLALLAISLIGTVVVSTTEELPPYDIMIHAIPHTHLDAGWLETMQIYYDSLVSQIFDSLLPELDKNPEYRFNWAEVGFLKMWWDRADENARGLFKSLVSRGQI